MPQKSLLFTPLTKAMLSEAELSIFRNYLKQNLNELKMPVCSDDPTTNVNALLYACSKGKEAIVKIIVEETPPEILVPLILEQDNAKRNALHYAFFKLTDAVLLDALCAPLNSEAFQKTLLMSEKGLLTPLNGLMRIHRAETIRRILGKGFIKLSGPEIAKAFSDLDKNKLITSSERLHIKGFMNVLLALSHLVEHFSVRANGTEEKCVIFSLCLQLLAIEDPAREARASQLIESPSYHQTPLSWAGITFDFRYHIKKLLEAIRAFHLWAKSQPALAGELFNLLCNLNRYLQEALPVKPPAIAALITCNDEIIQNGATPLQQSPNLSTEANPVPNYHRSANHSSFPSQGTQASPNGYQPNMFSSAPPPYEGAHQTQTGLIYYWKNPNYAGASAPPASEEDELIEFSGEKPQT